MQWILFVLAGWSTLVGGLFLATLSGDVAAQFLSLSRNSKLFVQAFVMSGIIVPIILYLYQHVYRLIGVKAKMPLYSLGRLYHFFTGVLLAIGLASLGFIIASFQGWSSLENGIQPING